ncbi:hypothetical protein Zmor_010939 [Zophobas morio]|uniref:Uncharacterized protein n=1 Tax=Zophobas morio TaxID=2755281 RepID=A0AA38IPT4_9CUCU|nr:hypothetical protein Zmor_010939 [Zophobas morio]
MQKDAQKYGISILGFSSDGDTRLLKAMRLNPRLPISSDENHLNIWDWYQMGFSDSDLTSYVQAWPTSIKIMACPKVPYVLPSINNSKTTEELLTLFERHKGIHTETNHHYTF